jgi:xylulokinase
MFQSEVFTRSFVQATGLEVALYQTDGSIGAALGAGIGAGLFAEPSEAFSHLRSLETISPQPIGGIYEDTYQRWKQELQLRLG